MYIKEWYQKNKKSIQKARRKYLNTNKGKIAYQKSCEKILYGIPKKVILGRDNYKCQICGSKNRLEIHHIDGNGSGRPTKEKNNNEENLITLCIPCHRKIDGYRKRKKGWSIKFEKCIICGSSEKPYFSKGMCSRCYELTRKKYKSEWYQKNKYSTVHN